MTTTEHTTEEFVTPALFTAGAVLSARGAANREETPEQEAKRLDAEASEARCAYFHGFEAMPWEEAFRHLTELTIAAVNAARITETEPPLSDMNVTLGGLYGAFYVAVVRDGATEFVISDDQSVWDAWTCLSTIIRQHCMPARPRERGCICR